MAASRLTYQAPKPRVRPIEWVKLVVARIFFPPILLWDGLKWLANKIGGKFIGKLALPAQKKEKIYEKTFGELNEENTTRFSKNPAFSAESIDVLTHDGATLDTFQITHKILKQVMHDRNLEEKYIIYVVGNSMCYEHKIDEMERDADRHSCHVIGFNFRGVGLSTGAPTEAADLVTDAIAQVQRLLDQGVNPENITLKSHSLGAAVATLTAKHFHDLGIKINIFNGRSFSTLSNVVIGAIRESFNKDEAGFLKKTAGKILAWIATPIVKFAVALIKWEIDAASAYQALPESHKEYMVVRPSKEDRKKGLPGDEVISPEASLHAALKDPRTKQKARIDKAIKILEDENSLALIGKDLDAAKEELKKARKNMKDRKMWTEARDSEDNYIEGHNVSLEELHTRSSAGFNREKTGLAFFDRFYERAQDHHLKARKAAEKQASVRRSR